MSKQKDSLGAARANHTFAAEDKKSTAGHAKSKLSSDNLTTKTEGTERINDSFTGRSFLSQEGHQASSRPESRSSASAGASRYHTSGVDYDSNSDRPVRQFNFYDAFVNLPSVLNDPRKPRPAEFLTRTWGDAFVETSVSPSPLLSEITLEAFRPYLRCINVREALLKGTRSSSDGSGRTSTNRPKHSCPDDLEEIPKVFFTSTFAVDQPGVFRHICPPEQTKAALWAARDRMSRYLDTVESEIARHVAIRAEAFFGVVTSHDLLQERMDASLEKVMALRSSLKTIQEGTVKPAVETVAKSQKCHNLERILEKLQTIATISQTQLTIQMLLSNGDFVGALDLITSTRDVVAVELSGLTCFRHLNHQLLEMERFIDKMMSMEFRRALSAHLNRAFDARHSPRMVEEERFAAIVTGLLRQRRINVVDWFREEALSALQATLKLVLIQTLNEHHSETAVEENEEDRSLPYHLLKTVNFEGLVGLFRALQGPLREILLRIRAAHDVASGLHAALLGQESRAGTGDGREGDGTLTATDLSRLTAQLQELLFAVGEETQEEIARMLSRSPAWRDLKNADLVSLWDVLEVVMKDAEEILGVRMTVLNAQLQKLAFAFVARFHEDRKQKLVLILDSERWTPAEIPVEFQSFVSSIFSGRTLLVPLPRQKSEDFMDVNGRTQLSSPKAVLASLTINDESFLVVGTVVLVLRMLGEYVALTDKLPLSMNISGDILQKVVELLKMFNTRTWQLVLGAGALNAAGLRSITSPETRLSQKSPSKNFDVNQSSDYCMLEKRPSETCIVSSLTTTPPTILRRIGCL